MGMMKLRHTLLSSLFLIFCFLTFLVIPNIGNADLPSSPSLNIPPVAELQRQISTLLPKAESGDSDAEFKLAMAYHNLWLHDAAQQDNLQNKLKWMEKAAESGHAEAQYWIGTDLGRKLRSKTEAIGWVKKSADQGFVRSQAELGNFISTESGNGPLSTFFCTNDVVQTCGFDSKLSPAYRYYEKLVRNGTLETAFNEIVGQQKGTETEQSVKQWGALIGAMILILAFFTSKAPKIVAALLSLGVMYFLDKLVFVYLADIGLLVVLAVALLRNARIRKQASDSKSNVGVFLCTVAVLAGGGLIYFFFRDVSISLERGQFILQIVLILLIGGAMTMTGKKEQQDQPVPQRQSHTTPDGFVRAEYGVPHCKYETTPEGFKITYNKMSFDLIKTYEEAMAKGNLIGMLLGLVLILIAGIVNLFNPTVIEVNKEAVIIKGKRYNRRDFSGFNVEKSVNVPRSGWSRDGVIATLGYTYGVRSFGIGGAWDHSQAQEVASALNQLLQATPMVGDEYQPSPEQLREAARPTDF
jgi:TPR repeat protein